jgi:hypothetical protein
LRQYDDALQWATKITTNLPYIVPLSTKLAPIEAENQSKLATNDAVWGRFVTIFWFSHCGASLLLLIWWRSWVKDSTEQAFSAAHSRSEFLCMKLCVCRVRSDLYVSPVLQCTYRTSLANPLLKK